MPKVKREQESRIYQAFVDRLGAGPHTGTTAFSLFLTLQQERPELFEGIAGDSRHSVHALLNRRGLTNG